MQEIVNNVAAIRARMAEAAREAGRDPAEITLCAASKMNDAQRVRAAVEAGVDCCGENRVQELVQKLPQGAYDGVPIHFIGHLQTNKVRQVVGVVDLIQSVDRLELLQCIEKEAAKKGLVQDILLEVNVGGEESKSGVRPDQVEELARKAAALPHVRLRGLMAIPPVAHVTGENQPYFAAMYQLFVDIKEKLDDNKTVIDCLSMGMSGDYPDAVRAGATLVRVGTALFGPRPPLHP